MRIAFIVQRYGTEILGGPEYACRLTAERLAERHDVDVLTTCARENVTWKNDYAEGADRVRGVTVRRFANSHTRDVADFTRYSEWIFQNPHTAADEMDWLKRQGPWSPGLIEYLKRHYKQYESLIFYNYLYAPTVLGLQIDPARSILVPAAHDEPAVHLDMYRDVFRMPRAIGYLSEPERRFVTQRFERTAAIEETMGCGVDLPPHHAYPRAAMQASETEQSPAAEQGSADGDDGGGDSGRFPSHVSSRGAGFKRRHRIHGSFALYGGRIDPGKGCEELIEYFSTYVASGGDASLVLMGLKLMPLPEEPFVNFAGMLSEQERLQALEAATVVVCPSPYESLSLIALEALAVGTPLLCNARSDVLVDHCLRSNGGLFYRDRDEFVECLNLLVADERLRAAMGRAGRDYVRKNYRWDVVLGKLDRMIAKVR
ncbi:MAG TPA: glycosyltransferase family 4 protein [Vicinamibacterales bacterium]|nr:glycosyltransferase family 4 protein [Vicinamibacterales bacterium]